MSELLLFLVIFAAIVYLLFGVGIAVSEIQNKKVCTPKDFYEDGYNWFGSWLIFIIRILLAFPFYIIGTIVILISKFIRWLLTVGR
jgi:hypothetical protein